MEGCYSNEMVPERFYKKVMFAMCANYGQIRAMGLHLEFISKVALSNLIDTLIKLEVNLSTIDYLLSDMLSSIHRQQYIIAFIKHGMYLGSIANLTERDLIKLDISLIQSKHPSFNLALSLIEVVQRQPALLLPFLLRVLTVWSSHQLLKIGSPCQHAYLTYLSHQILLNPALKQDTLSTNDDLLT